MIKVEIKDKDGKVTHKGQFGSMSEADAWIAGQEAMEEPWGYTNSDYTIVRTDMSNDPGLLAQVKKQQRRDRYNELGVTGEALLEALVEHVKENRPEKLNQLQALRQQVKTEIP